jgi:hypothetical protein
MDQIMAAPAAGSSLIDWAVSGRAVPGERESGDLHVVAPFAGGVLIGAVDGLGHGVEAAAASRKAVEILGANAEEPLIPLVNRCHQALRRTRGAVLSIAAISAAEGMMQWTAIGNVEAVLFRAGPESRRESVSPRSGVVGYQLPPLRTAAHAIAPGDVLVFATDGIRENFAAAMRLNLSPQEAAHDILHRFGKDSDDALVLVARWLGRTP